MLAAHAVLCKENIENSLELWPVANRLDKIGLVPLLMYPFLLPKRGQPQGEQVCSLISHALCLALLQAKVKYQAVSHLPEILMQQGWKQRGSLSVSLICYQR